VSVPDTQGWQVVAHDNLEIFVVDVGQGLGRVYDRPELLLSEPLELERLLESGSWREVPPYDFDPQLLAGVQILTRRPL
jgi:hypothetical protein